ncbi:MAG: chemotaxis protein CheW [Spirochaetaceae bacterium]|jgi:purine-binding chemotaxis protein CheW|nr:chemotaxis protein CheW [Spirochaetaceae bacterium]
METLDLAQINTDLHEKLERVENVDFKMVTFSLSGKDYGIDIMNVKEIAKADKFTFVPNAAGFVRGVYNLRGDIIPIIDLRTFFHLTVTKRALEDDQNENMLILKIDDHVYGIIVDKIDKVVGINQESIQPPHPIFGDINIKYISGVVEKEGALYIILDVVRIFSPREQSEEDARVQSEAQSAAYFEQMAAAMQAGAFAQQAAGGAASAGLLAAAAAVAGSAPPADNVLGFIKEQLAALRRFYPSPVNEDWIKRRFTSWQAARSAADTQLKTSGDADAYLETFFSSFSGRLWSDDYAYAVKNALPENSASQINAWNAGCGRGLETYCLACILKMRYPNARIKVWANDNDIMAIANAPNITFDLSEVPPFCQAFLVKGTSGFAFGPMIKDSIVFEYHDICNENALPDLDVVFIRDTLSFLQPKGQEKVLQEISERLKQGGAVFLGQNEKMFGSQWLPAGKEPAAAFIKA